MKPRAACWFAPALAALALACAAETSPDAVAADVSAMVERYFELGNAGDFEAAFTSFQDPSGVADGTLVPDWEEHRRSNVLPFLNGLEDVVFDLQEFSVDVLGENIAVASGRYQFSALQDGAAILNPPTAFSWVLQEEGGEWRVRHWHTSMP